MAENDTLTAAKGLLEALDRHTPSEGLASNRECALSP